MYTWTHKADYASEHDCNIQLEQKSTSSCYCVYVIIIFTAQQGQAELVLFETEYYCTVAMILRYEVILITHWGRFENHRQNIMTVMKHQLILENIWTEFQIVPKQKEALTF